MSYNLVDPTTGDLTRVAGNSNIVDTAIRTDSTWSSKKISADLGELENITRLTDFDEAIPEPGKNKIYYVNKTLGTYKCAQWRVESTYYDVSGLKQYRGVQKATSINGVDNIMLMREYYLDDNNVMRWSDWQELATTDSTLKTIQLSGSVDCNTLTEPGLYIARAGAVSALTNIPVETGSAVQMSGGFSILVTKTNTESVFYGMQMFIPYGFDLPFIRKSYYVNGQYWTDWKELATESTLFEYKTMDTGDADQIRSFAEGKLYFLKVVNAFNVVDDAGTRYQIPAFAEATFFKHSGDLTVQFHSYYGTSGIWEVFYDSNGQTRGKKIV